MQRFNLFHRQLVVAAHHDLRAQFAQVLDQVVGERIVVVEDKDHGEFQCIARAVANVPCGTRRTRCL